MTKWEILTFYISTIHCVIYMLCILYNMQYIFDFDSEYKASVVTKVLSIKSEKKVYNENYMQKVYTCIIKDHNYLW